MGLLLRIYVWKKSMGRQCCRFHLHYSGLKCAVWILYWVNGIRQLFTWIAAAATVAYVAVYSYTSERRITQFIITWHYIWQWQASNAVGPLFTRKTPFYWYRDSQYKPETVVRPSEVYTGDSYTRKTVSFLVQINKGPELTKSSHI